MKKSTNEQRPGRRSEAIEAVVSIARAQGIEVEQPIVLADSNNTAIHLAPAPVVACVATSPFTRSGSSLERELQVTSFLANRDADVVSPSSELPVRVYEERGFKMTFWEYLPAAPDQRPTGRELGESFRGVLHALAEFTEPLPPWTDKITEVGELLRSQGQLELGGRDIELVLAEYERATDELGRFDLEAQPLHGDAHFGNVIATSDGPRWLDFEAACRGPKEWDLSAFGSDRRAKEAVAVFSGINPDGLEVLQRLREVSVIAWCTVDGSAPILRQTADEKLSELRSRAKRETLN